MKVVILAAGVGSRLGNPYPKPLTPLSNGESILGRQIRVLGEALPRSTFCVVVGFKKDMIIEAFPESLFVYNQRFGDTNTSKSLLKGLELTGMESVLWLNGDVVFDSSLIDLLLPKFGSDQSFVCVDTKSVGDEEVKYNLDDEGNIREISKAVSDPLGEAVGINYVGSHDKERLMARLRACDDQDYFEKGIEVAIQKDGLVFEAVDITDYPCIEVDFAEDLGAAREMF